MDSATAGQGLDGSAPGKQHVLQAVVSLWLILRGRPHRDDGKEKGAKENQMRRPNVKYYLSQLTDPVPSQPLSTPASLLQAPSSSSCRITLAGRERCGCLTSGRQRQLSPDILLQTTNSFSGSPATLGDLSVIKIVTMLIQDD